MGGRIEGEWEQGREKMKRGGGREINTELVERQSRERGG